MITNLRNQIQKKGFQVLLWIVLLSFFIDIVLRFNKNSSKSVDYIGKVNGYPILKSDFARKINQEYHILHRVREQLGADADAYLKQQGYTQNPEERVLQDLISEKLIHSAIKSLKIRISPDYVEQKIVDPLFVIDSLSDIVPPEAFMTPNGLNYKAVHEFLVRQGISDEDFENKIKGSIEKYLLNEMLASTLYIPQALVKEQYIRLYVQKRFNIAIFDIQNYIKKIKQELPKDLRSQVDSEDLKKFFHSKSQLYMTPEKRKGKIWTFDPEKYGAYVSDKDMEISYIRNRKDYVERPEELTARQIVLKADKQKEAREIIERVRKNPKSFATEAKKYSIASDKGSIITFKRTGKEPRLENAAFGLTKDEDMTSAIPTAQGLTILQRISKVDISYQDFKKVKETVRTKVQKEKFAKQFATDAHRILSQLQDNSDIFTKFINSKSAQEKLTDVITKDNTSAMAKKLFGLRESKKAFYVADGKGYFIELVSVEKSNLPEFDSVKDKVLADYYKDKAWQQLTQDLKQAKTILVDGITNIEAVAKKFNATLETTPLFSPQAAQWNEYFEKLKISTEKVNLLSQINAVVDETSDTHGYLIQLKELDEIKEEDFISKKDELTRSLYQGELALLHTMLISSLRNKATIEIDKEAINRIKKF